VIVLIMVLGAVLVAAGWRAVTTRRASIWAVVAAVNAAAGIAALATGRVSLSPRVEVSRAAAIGLLAGLGLYFATVIFVLFVRRWPAFSRHVASLYELRGGLPLPVAVALASGVTAPGEEAFWRGLFQSHLSQGGSRTSAAVLTWAVYVAANALSASLPISAAALVGGAVWGGLALWSGGVLPSLLCHAVWTGLMVAVPPPGAVAVGVGRT
jgi:membrane protease YdiL (CAAX protease family)